MDKKEEKKIIRQEFLTGERALFMGKNLDIYDTIFDDGESPLKESRGINLYGSMFKWKYPLWYSKNIVAEDCHWFEMARAGVWYTDNIAVRRALIQADAPRVLLGAEVLICDGMERLNGLRELCLEGTNELLLEMPFYRWPAPIWDTLYRLNDLRDIQIVIAHADRYPPEDIHPLISEGIPLQLNAECLRKHLHRKRYLEWIQKGYVSYLGSDIHEFGSGYHDFEKCRKLLCRYL